MAHLGWRSRLRKYLDYGLGILCSLAGIAVALGICFLVGWLVYVIVG